MIKWVATISVPEDDGTIATVHVEGTKADLQTVMMAVPAEWVIEKKAATWECDGRDNCRVDA